MAHKVAHNILSESNHTRNIENHSTSYAVIVLYTADKAVVQVIHDTVLHHLEDPPLLSAVLFKTS